MDASTLTRGHEDPIGMCARILLVEDDRVQRELLRRRLEGWGYDVVTADNGKVGLDSLGQALDPQVIISDIRMPTMDGFAFLEHVRAHPKYSDIPVAFVTNLCDKEDRR